LPSRSWSFPGRAGPATTRSLPGLDVEGERLMTSIEAEDMAHEGEREPVLAG
jgi:hypothetical protein